MSYTSPSSQPASTPPGWTKISYLKSLPKPFFESSFPLLVAVLNPKQFLWDGVEGILLSSHCCFQIHFFYPSLRATTLEVYGTGLIQQNCPSSLQPSTNSCSILLVALRFNSLFSCPIYIIQVSSPPSAYLSVSALSPLRATPAVPQPPILTHHLDLVIFSGYSFSIAMISST